MKVSRIEWTFHTSNVEGSGTDSPVSLDIFRDNNKLVSVWQERGETARLDRGEVGTYFWTFQNPTGIGTSVSGTPVPYTVDFPGGLAGHLKVVFKIHGDDAWRVGVIESAVISVEMKGVPGTIDSVHFEEIRNEFTFNGEDVLSTDPGEGHVSLELDY